MSELINNSQKRKETLKHMISRLNDGETPEAIRKQLAQAMGQVPYETVVEVEQELLDEGMPFTRMLSMCDIHAAALKGRIDTTHSQQAPPGHPVHTFIEENNALRKEIALLNELIVKLRGEKDPEATKLLLIQIRMRFNNLSDVDKHYKRKEFLLFPFLEQHGTTGPPKVMWGKHDETRRLLSGAIETLVVLNSADRETTNAAIGTKLVPAIESIDEMIFKEEKILYPMSLDVITDQEWYQIYSQSMEVGFCLYDPRDEWKPEGVAAAAAQKVAGDRIQLPTGSFTIAELDAFLNTLPFDITFVDADDTVRYFSAGRDRIFQRNRAVIGRKVQLCHPPNSAWIVQRILDDFRSGGEDRAPFWIELNGKFVHIEYFAVRDKEGKYLGTLEVTQDLTEKRSLTGEQRLLNYVKDWRGDK
jgi:DUF438 domain-containing protein